MPREKKIVPCRRGCGCGGRCKRFLAFVSFMLGEWVGFGFVRVGWGTEPLKMSARTFSAGEDIRSRLTSGFPSSPRQKKENCYSHAPSASFIAHSAREMSPKPNPDRILKDIITSVSLSAATTPRCSPSSFCTAATRSLLQFDGVDSLSKRQRTQRFLVRVACRADLQ